MIEILTFEQSIGPLIQTAKPRTVPDSERTDSWMCKYNL
jgi:hypothetical protein